MYHHVPLESNACNWYLQGVVLIFFWLFEIAPKENVGIFGTFSLSERRRLSIESLSTEFWFLFHLAMDRTLENPPVPEGSDIVVQPLILKETSEVKF